MAVYILLSMELLLLFKPRERKIDDTPARIIFSVGDILGFIYIFFFFRTRVSDAG